MFSKRGFFLFVVVIGVLFLPYGHTRGVNGGTECAVCTVLVSLGEQLAQLDNGTVVDSLLKLCDQLPDKYDDPCRIVVAIATPTLIKLFDKEVDADTACHALGLCKTDPGQPECQLYQQKKYNIQNKLLKINPDWKTEVQVDQVRKLQDNICDSLPVLKALCQSVYTKIDGHLPVEDLDNDKFSELKTLRGSYWRGKDCNDVQKDIYPGRRPYQSDVFEDSNCNGILGIDSASGKAYEDLFCKGTQQMGIAILGDSAAAHFHIPPQWLTATDLKANVFADIPMIIENEFDWPQLSSTTGYMNTTTWSTISGPTDSLYLRLRERNLCNHRDFQNIGVNGARTSSMNQTIQYTLARDQKVDKPLIVIYSLIGNDVCNGHLDTIAHMTKPSDMKANAMSSLKYLDTILPDGSLVLMTGMVDGRILYDTLAERVHPLGSLNKDIRYRDIYDYLSCLQISPCNGWMTSNETLRNITSQRAQQLSESLKEATQSQNYKHFKVEYTDFDFEAIIDTWKKQGGETWQLIEPVDGFHPGQIAQALAADYIWKVLEKKFPNDFPKINPNNKNIFNIFGDQKGY